MSNMKVYCIVVENKLFIEAKDMVIILKDLAGEMKNDQSRNSVNCLANDITACMKKQAIQKF